MDRYRNNDIESQCVQTHEGEARKAQYRDRVNSQQEVTTQNQRTEVLCLQDEDNYRNLTKSGSTASVKHCQKNHFAVSKISDTVLRVKPVSSVLKLQNRQTTSEHFKNIKQLYDTGIERHGKHTTRNVGSDSHQTEQELDIKTELETKSPTKPPSEQIWAKRELAKPGDIGSVVYACVSQALVSIKSELPVVPLVCLPKLSKNLTSVCTMKKVEVNQSSPGETSGSRKSSPASHSPVGREQQRVSPSVTPQKREKAIRTASPKVSPTSNGKDKLVSQKKKRLQAAKTDMSTDTVTTNSCSPTQPKGKVQLPNGNSVELSKLRTSPLKNTVTDSSKQTKAASVNPKKTKDETNSPQKVKSANNSPMKGQSESSDKTSPSKDNVPKEVASPPPERGRQKNYSSKPSSKTSLESKANSEICVSRNDSASEHSVTPTINVSDSSPIRELRSSHRSNTLVLSQGNKTALTETLHVDTSSRSQRRIRSPSGRYSDDMILYPWDSPRPKVSPRRSPREKMADRGDPINYDTVKDKSPVLKTSEDDIVQYSGEKRESKNDNSSAVSNISAARELDFNGRIDRQRSNSPQPSTSTNPEKESGVKLISLAQLINKVSSAINQSEDDQLSKLFGHIEGPESEEESESSEGDEEEEEDISKKEIKEETSREGEEMSSENKETLDIDCDKDSERHNENDRVDQMDTSEECETKDKCDNNDDDSDEKLTEDQDGTSIKAESIRDKSGNLDNLEGSEENKVDDLISKPFAQDSLPMSPIRLSKETVKEALSITSLQSPSRKISEQQNSGKDKTAPSEKDENECVGSSLDNLPDTSDNVDGDPEKARNIFDLFGINARQRSISVNSSKNSSRKSSVCDSVEQMEEKDSENKETAEKTHGSQDNSLSVEDNEEMSGQCVGAGKDNVSEMNSESPAVIDLVETTECSQSVTSVPTVVVLSDDDESPAKDTSASSNSVEKPSTGDSLKSQLRVTDRGGYSSLRASPRCCPKISTVRKVVQPQPIEVLCAVEKVVTDKKCAFFSDQLEKYLEADKENKTLKLVQAKEEKAKIEMMELQSQIEAEAALAKQVCSSEPDIDSFDGHLFMSFPSEEALKAHVEIEKSLDWVDQAYFLKVIQLKNLRERAEAQGSRVVDVKNKQEQKQNMRGVHKRFQKYQRLFRKELEIMLKAKEKRVPIQLMTRTPEKTSDITKIKGWKNKFSNTDELQQATGLHFSESGKLHWRTEDRILKELNPDDVKEIGLDLKKKRRKLVHFTKRKGLSKSETKSSVQDELEDGETEDVPEIPEEKHEEKLPYCVKYFSQHKYDKRKRFVKKLGLTKEDEFILKKLGSLHVVMRGAAQARKAATSNDAEKNAKAKKSKSSLQITKLTQSMALAAASALDRKLITKAKSLAKKNTIKAELKKEKEPEDIPSGSLKMEIKQELVDPEYPEEMPTVEESAVKQEVEDIESEKAVKPSTERLSKEDSIPQTGISEEGERENKARETPCNKPGCRYGCICHLCKIHGGTEEEDEEEEEKEGEPNRRQVCDKEYCKLGCICESIERKPEEPEYHCGKPACMFACRCKKVKKNETNTEVSASSSPSRGDVPQKSKRGRKSLLMGKKNSPSEQQDDEQILKTKMKDEDTEDWEPPSKKRRRQPNANRFANLPRRESTYRLAKNLDAVSRKALMVYESSEMYTEQKTRKRRSDPLPEDEMMAPVSKSEDDIIVNQPENSVTITSQPIRNSAYAVSLLGTPSGSQEPSKELGTLTSEPIYLLDSEDEEGSESKVNKKEVTVGNDQTFKSSPAETVASVTKEIKQDTVPRETTPEESSSAKASRITPPNPSNTTLQQRPLTAAEKLGLTRKIIKPEKVPEPLPEPVETEKEDGKWRTQMVCLKAKKKSSDSHGKPEYEIKLLEIISNCRWESDRTNMLSKISHLLSKGCGNKLESVPWNRYVLNFLQQASKPALIPHELKSKLPNSMYSIRVRVTLREPKVSKKPEQAELLKRDDGGKDDDVEVTKVEKPNERSVQEEMLEAALGTLTQEDKQRYYNLKQQQNLIKKIRFAERLKALLNRQEGMELADKDRNKVTPEAVEKALKRYKTQLWKSYTGASNMTISQLKHAVQLAKSNDYSDKLSESIQSIESCAKLNSSPSNSTPPTPEPVLPSSSVNTGITIAVSSSSEGYFFTTSSSGVTSVSSKAQGQSQDRLPPPTSISDDKTLSPSTMARIEANQGFVVNAHSKTSAQKPPNQVTNKVLQPGLKQSEVLLIPVGEDGKDVPNSAQVLSAKLSVIATTGVTSVQSVATVAENYVTSNSSGSVKGPSSVLPVQKQAVTVMSSGTPVQTNQQFPYKVPIIYASVPSTCSGTIAGHSVVSTTATPICITSSDGSKVFLGPKQLGPNTPRMVLNAIQPLSGPVMLNNIQTPVGPRMLINPVSSVSGGQPVILNPVRPVLSVPSATVQGGITPIGIKKTGSAKIEVSGSVTKLIETVSSSTPIVTTGLVNVFTTGPGGSSSLLNTKSTSVPGQVAMAITPNSLIGTQPQAPYRILSAIPGGPAGKPIIHLVPVPTTSSTGSVSTGSSGSKPEYIAVPVQISAPPSSVPVRLPLMHAPQIQAVPPPLANTTVTNSVPILSAPKISPHGLPVQPHQGGFIPLTSLNHIQSHFVMAKVPGSEVKAQNIGSKKGKKKKSSEKKKRSTSGKGGNSGNSVLGASGSNTVSGVEDSQLKGVLPPTSDTNQPGEEQKVWKVSKTLDGNSGKESDGKRNFLVGGGDTEGNCPSSSQQSVSSVDSTCNVKDLIKNTTAAGQEIASKLGSVEDGVYSNSLETENESVIRSILDDCDFWDSDEDSLFIDEMYNSSIESPDLISGIPGRIENVSKSLLRKRKKRSKNGSQKKSRSSSPCGSSWSGSDSSVQLFIDDTEDFDGDIDSAEPKMLLPDQTPGTSNSSQNRRKLTLKPATEQQGDIEFTEGCGKVAEDQSLPVSMKKMVQAVRTQSERKRRREVKHLFSRLQHELYHNSMSPRDLEDIPKAQVLRRSLGLLTRLEDRMKMLETAKEVRISSQRNLKKRLNELTEYFVKSGIDETIINNFLKSVAKATITKSTPQLQQAQTSSATVTAICTVVSGADNSVLPPNSTKRIGRKPKVEIYIDNPEDLEAELAKPDENWETFMQSVPVMEVESISDALQHDAELSDDDEVRSSTGDLALDHSGAWTVSDFVAEENDKKSMKKVENSGCAVSLVTSLLENNDHDVVEIDDPTLHLKKPEIIDLGD